MATYLLLNMPAVRHLGFVVRVLRLTIRK